MASDRPPAHPQDRSKIGHGRSRRPGRSLSGLLVGIRGLGEPHPGGEDSAEIVEGVGHGGLNLRQPTGECAVPAWSSSPLR